MQRQTNDDTTRSILHFFVPTRMCLEIKLGHVYHAVHFLSKTELVLTILRV